MKEFNLEKNILVLEKKKLMNMAIADCQRLQLRIKDLMHELDFTIKRKGKIAQVAIQAEHLCKLTRLYQKSLIAFQGRRIQYFVERGERK
jgi:hypothetical protein